VIFGAGGETRLQILTRRRSSGSQAAARGFACWQNIAPPFSSPRNTRRCVALLIIL